MISQIKQNLSWKFLTVQILCLLSLFMISTGYTNTVGGKAFSIFQVLLDTEEGNIIQKGGVTGYDLWRKALNSRANLMFPILISMGYSFSMYYEKKGSRRYILTRENRFRYCFNKITAAMISSGVILVVSMLILGFLIRIRFLSSIPLFRVGRSGVIQVLRKLLCTFFYGVELSLFVVSVSIFFDDKYELTCLPILLKYLLQIVTDRLVFWGLSENSNLCLHMADVTLNPENMLNDYSSLKCKLESLFIAFVMYIISVFLLNYRIKRDERYGIS